jgi:hypothetical protein
MVEVKGAAEAEVKAIKLIKEKHPKLRRILFKRVEKKDNSWLIEGEVWFKWLHLFTVKKTFRLQISSETGEATSYQETQETHFKVWFPPHA